MYKNKLFEFQFFSLNTIEEDRWVFPTLAFEQIKRKLYPYITVILVAGHSEFYFRLYRNDDRINV